MDKKVVKILLDTIKTSQDNCSINWFYWDTYMKFITEEDFNYAKQHSIMFDQEKISHNEIFSRIKKAVAKINRQDVINAFILQLEYKTTRITFIYIKFLYCKKCDGARFFSKSKTKCFTFD